MGHQNVGQVLNCYDFYLKFFTFPELLSILFYLYTIGRILLYESVCIFLRVLCVYFCGVCGSEMVVVVEGAFWAVGARGCMETTSSPSLWISRWAASRNFLWSRRTERVKWYRRNNTSNYWNITNRMDFQVTHHMFELNHFNFKGT